MTRFDLFDLRGQSDFGEKDLGSTSVNERPRDDGGVRRVLSSGSRRDENLGFCIDPKYNWRVPALSIFYVLYKGVERFPGSEKSEGTTTR